MPAALRRALLASELDTARDTRPGCAASASMKKFTVEPVPTPMVAPAATSSSAACAARLRARYRARYAPGMCGERVDEEVHGGAGAHADGGARGDQFQCGERCSPPSSIPRAIRARDVRRARR